MLFSFHEVIYSRGYHVYRNESWKNIYEGQSVEVSQDVGNTKDPYCCKITIKLISKLTRTTLGHVPRELSRYAWFFLKKGAVIRGEVKSVEHRKSPIADGGMEVPLTLTFSYEDQAILGRMRECVTAQLALSRTATEEHSDED